MRCPEARQALSARLDGESLDDPGALDDHLERCASCREFEESSAALRRAGMTLDRPADPALTDRVLAALEPDRSHSVEARWVRVGLVVVALVQGAIAIPALLHGGAGMTAHQARHLGVFSLALAGGFVYTALRPRRVGALLPFAALLGAGLVVTGVLDAAAGRTPIAGESAHLLEIIGLVLMWILTRLERPRPRTGTGPLRPSRSGS